MADRKRWILVGGGLLVLAGIVAVAVWASPRTPASTAQSAAPSTSTFVLQATDLSQEESFDAELRYADVAPIYALKSGTVTWLPAEGSTVDCGSTAYRLDDQPVTYLCGAVPAWRDLQWDASGPDVRQLEEYLRDAGHAPSDMDVDGEFTWATSHAVMAWQATLGVSENGIVHLGDVVFGPHSRRAGEAGAPLGSRVVPGQAVFQTSSTGVVAVVAVPAHSRNLFAEGAIAAIDLPDGTSVEAVVSSVRARTTSTGPESEGDPTAEAILTTSDGGAAAWAGARVTAQIESARVEGVLAVPVSAITATASGGYAVEVVRENDDDGTAEADLVGVTLGMFADGMVEITGEGLESGLEVVIPS